MGRDLGLGVEAFFEHVLDGVDTPARAIALVAKDHVRGTGCRAKSAMDAAPQDAFGFGDRWIFKLFFGEIGLHLLLSPVPFKCSRTSGLD